ncbi:hypothetical protein ACFWU3_27920 [Streptomyces sp. NPDC058685]|uniref:hypothetical protein n=1 Tax=Streptomyces sp. NPDC058685 TaxID=3346598 RepID=UPI003658F197
MIRGRSSIDLDRSRFDDIHDRPDPRAHVQRLARLSYETPHHAQRVFRETIAERASAHGSGPFTVLDLCCSYGINAALLNHHVTLAELYEHWTRPDAQRLTHAELVRCDREFFALRRRSDAVPVVGVDIAGNAVRYAQSVGLLDETYTENLECCPPSRHLRRAMAGTGLITVSAGIGHVTWRTFETLLRCAQVPVWVGAFVPRTVAYRPVAERLSRHGLVTRTDTGRTHPRRLFTGPAEQRRVVERALRGGHDPSGLETRGRCHTHLHQSRPAAAWAHTGTKS